MINLWLGVVAAGLRCGNISISNGCAEPKMEIESRYCSRITTGNNAQLRHNYNWQADGRGCGRGRGQCQQQQHQLNQRQQQQWATTTTRRYFWKNMPVWVGICIWVFGLCSRIVRLSLLGSNLSCCSMWPNIMIAYFCRCLIKIKTHTETVYMYINSSIACISAIRQ